MTIKNTYRNSNLNNDEVKKSRRYRLAKILAKESEGYHGSEKTETPVSLVRELHNLVKTLHRPLKTKNYDDNLILVVGKSGMGKSLALLTLALGFIPFPLKYMDSFRWWKYVAKTPDRLPIYVGLSEIKTLRDKWFRPDGVCERDGEGLWVPGFWSDFYSHALGEESISENLKSSLAKLYKDGKLLFLLDGMNEMNFLSTNDEILNFMCALHQAVGNNLCILATTPLDTDFDIQSGVLKSYYISQMDSYSLKKLLKVFHINRNEIYRKPILEYPFFLGIIIKIKETIKSIDGVCEQYPYSLIKRYISLKLQKENYSIDYEAIKRLSRMVYNSYRENHIINDGFFEIDSLFTTGREQNLKTLLFSMKILKTGSGEKIFFYHDWYWRFFMALGCENAECKEAPGYWKHYKILSSGRNIREEAPDPIQIAEDIHLAPIMAMYLCGVPEQLQYFLEDCYRYSYSADYTKQLTLFEYIAENFLGFLPEHQCQTSNGQSIPSPRMLDDFIITHKEKDDFRIRIFWVKVVVYCKLETQRMIIERIFNGESEWLKKKLINSYALHNNGNKLFQNAVGYSFDCYRRNSAFSQQSLQELQIKKYFLMQYMSEMYENSFVYKKLFKGMEGDVGKRLHSFIKFRYHDMTATWGLYIFFLLLFVINMVLLWNNRHVSNGNIWFLIVKFAGFLIFAGSFRAWTEQCKYSEDVYLEIFGKASRWMTINELVEMLGENMRVYFFKGFFKAAKDGSLGEFLPVLLDWVRVRPSVIILLSMMILLIWPHLIFLSTQWYHCILMVAAVLFLWIPVTDYMYLWTAKKYRMICNKRSQKGVKNRMQQFWENNASFVLMLKSLFLIFVIFTLGTVFTLSSVYFIIKIITALLFTAMVISIVYSIGSSAKAKKKQDCQMLEEMKGKAAEERTADLNTFMRLQTSEGQKRYLRMLHKDFHINDEWLKACKSEAVKEVFYELDIPYDKGSRC